MQFPVFIRLHRSRQFLTALVGAHLFAASAIFISQVSWPAGLPLLLAILASAARSFTRTKPSGLRLLDAKGGMEVVRSDGVSTPAMVCADTTSFRYLMVMRLKFIEAPGGTCLVLFPDALSREDHCTLRIWLRWGFSSPRTANAGG